MKLLSGKVAVITGATRGIGKAIALRFAEQGADIVFTGSAHSEHAKSTEQQITALSVKVKFFASNAASFQAAHQVIEQTAAEFGRIDILVNNAGITKDGMLLRMSESQWDEVIAVNLKSAFNFTHAAAPAMMKQRSGSIINMTSVVGVSGNAAQANYAASKAALIGFTKSIAKELGSRGIRANAIAPGFIDTDMTAALPDDIKKKWTDTIPLKRCGTADDVAAAALFLASEMAAYITGQTLCVCGGMNM
jgi:3-oxoacyl-[acyl-carrier protein] reductase